MSRLVKGGALKGGALKGGGEGIAVKAKTKRQKAKTKRQKAKTKRQKAKTKNQKIEIITNMLHSQITIALL